MRIYITSPEGTRRLTLIQCDECDATIKPNPLISKSGWVKNYQDNGPGTDKFQKDLCPRH